jgi:hypothetical protein
MREIDLIPASYRRAQTHVLWVRALFGAFGAVVVGTLVVWLGLGAAIAGIRAQTAELQRQQAISIQESEQLASLAQTSDSYRRQLQLLKGLRSGTEATNLFLVMDDALVGDDVWFTNWQFRRAGVTTPDGKALEASYFIVVPEGGRPPESWRVETHMTITGQAENYSALSEFVKRLLSHSEIATVRVRRSELQHYEPHTIIDFDLAVVINGKVGD